MYPPPPPVAARPRPPWSVIAATVALGVVASMLGLLRWPRPVWTSGSGWMVTDVPPPLWGFVLGTTAVCVIASVVLTMRAVHAQARDLVIWVWVALVLLAAAALVWNALYDAAVSTMEFGAPIPIFHWLFTFAPAALAGWLFSRRGREAQFAAALGTGVVTVPLFALSWALLSPRPGLGGIVDVLRVTAVLAVAPLAGGVALVGAMGGGPVRPPDATDSRKQL